MAEYPRFRPTLTALQQLGLAAYNSEQLVTHNRAKAARKKAGIKGRKASKAWYKEHRNDWVQPDA